MEINYLGEEPLFFNDDIGDFKIVSVLSFSITRQEYLKRIFEYIHEDRDGKLIYYFPESSNNSFDFINEMLYVHLFHEITYIFDKAFNSYCKYSGKDKNYIIHTENEIRTNLVIKYNDCDIRYSFDELLTFLRNEALKRFNLEVKFGFVKDIIFRNINYNTVIYFLNIDLNELCMENIEKSQDINFTRNISFNPFLDSQQDIIRKINNIYYNMPTKGVKINKTKLISQSDRLKRIFDVYYINYYLKECSPTIIYKILRKRFGHIFNEFTLAGDFSNLNNEAQQYKIYVNKDLEFIKNIKEVYKLLEY